MIIATATDVSAASTPNAHDHFARARFNMVEGQIRTNRVSDPSLLRALSDIPRQVFVPGVLASVAYVDTSIAVAPGRYMMEPMFLARLLQEAAVVAGERALVVGATTGYSAAILAELGARVTALESDPDLAARARTTLSGLGLGHVAVETGALTAGWAAAAPYDVILIDGMVSATPAFVADQLAERGRLLAIVAQEGRCGSGMLYRKLGGAISGRALFDASAPFIPGFEPRPQFVL